MLTFYEVGKRALPGLKEVERLFAELKAKVDKNPQSVLKKLESKCGEIFGPKFYFFIDRDVYSYNCTAVCYLKEDKTYEAVKAPDQIKLNHVHTIFLFYGRDLISQLTPAELTAVMLHEIGHYIVRFKEVLYYISRPYLFFPASVALNLLATFSLTKTLLGILPVYVLLLILVNKVCLHPQEMLADRVAVEYGYGDELMSVIGKFEKIDPVASIKEKSFLKRIYFFLKDVFHTHPSSETRIRSIFKQIIKHYPENYPHIKAVLERIPHGKELIT